MSVVKGHARSSMSAPTVSDVGKRTARSSQKSSQADIADTSSARKPKASRIKTRKGSPTAESPPPSKGKTSNVNASFCLTNIPNTRLSPTSARESTSTDPACYPFWDNRWQEEYRRWWSPQKTDCVDSPSNSSPGSSKRTERDSWFSIKQINLQKPSSAKTSSPSCKYSLVDGTAAEDTLTDNPVRKIRIYPTPEQKGRLAKMAGAVRFLFNKTSEMIRDKVVPFSDAAAHSEKSENRKIAFDQKHSGQKQYKETKHPWLNFMYMRDHLVKNDSRFVSENPWLKEVANATRQIAVKEAIANHKAALSNLRAGNITHFEAPFRKKKNRSWSVGLDATQMQNDRVLPASDFGHIRVAERKFLMGRYSNQIRITRDKQMRYHVLIFPAGEGKRRKKTKKQTAKQKRRRMKQRRRKTSSRDTDENETAVEQPTVEQIEVEQDNKLPVMSVDPGIRTRHTVYSTDERIIEIGSGDVQKLVRIAKLVDKHISRACSPETNHRMRRRLLKQRLKLTARIANLKREMDYLTIDFFVKNARAVVLPPFKVHGMACRLRHKTARQLLCWGHGLFKQRLLDVARRRGLEVLIAAEHYTSKTCGECGVLNESLGGKKTFLCASCGYEADRDHNGARNIFLRAIREKQ